MASNWMMKIMTAPVSNRTGNGGVENFERGILSLKPDLRLER
jgi:hypothetical protein